MSLMMDDDDVSNRDDTVEMVAAIGPMMVTPAQKGLMTLMAKELMPFRKVAEEFRMIDNPTRTVYIPLGEGAELVERLREGEGGRSLFRRLGQYGVTVYEDHFNALERAGDLERLPDGSAILRNTALYSRVTGLSLEADGGKAEII